MSENETTSALLMDRGLALGNSEDAFQRRALHVKVANKPDEGIPFTFDEGEETYLDFSGSLTSGIEHTVISYVVPANKKIKISKMIISSKFSARFELLINGITVMGGYTSAAQTFKDIDIKPSRVALQNSIVEFKILVRSGAPAHKVYVNLIASLI